MTNFILAMLSILGLTLAAWLVRRMVRAELCPVCFGVAGTWLWMIVARAGGVAVDQTMLAVLMGGSAVGVAQWLGDRLPAGRSVLLWKALAIPVGAAAAYGAVTAQWTLAAIAALLLAVVAMYFGANRRGTPVDEKTISELEERMKKCC